MTDLLSLPSNPSKNVPSNDVNDDYICMDDEIFIDVNQNSFEEQCGFVSHVIILLMSIYYTTWILSFYCVPIPILQTNSTVDWKQQAMYLHSSKQQQQQQQQGPPLWTTILPLVVIFLFFLIPIVYGGCINRSAVVITTQKNQRSLSILQDTHTIRPMYVSPHNITTSTDLHDDYNATRYFQNPMSWTPIRYGTESLMNKRNINNNDRNKFTTTVPDICDIDVADINDLLHMKYIKHGPKRKE